MSKSLLMSHLRLGGKRLIVADSDPSENPFDYGQTQWAALRAAHQSTSLEPLGSVMVRLYNQARTYFQSR